MRALFAASFAALLIPVVAAADDGGAADALEIWAPLPAAPRAIAAGPVGLHVVRRRAGKLAPVGDVVVSASAGEVQALPSTDPYLARAMFVPAPAQEGSVLVVATAAHDDAALDDTAPAHLALALEQHAMPRVEVALARPELTKGRDEPDVEVTVRTVGKDGVLLGDVVPRLFTNTGEVTTPTRVSAGVFRARYAPSSAPYPEVAVLVALLPWPHEASAAAAVGLAVLKQPAAIELPGETRPFVDMTVEIAGREFGPVRADDVGHFSVPVVVPPGYGVGAGTSRDKLGNVKKTKIDLHLPPTKRLALAAHPRVLVADGSSHALVVLTTLTEKGDLLTDAAPVATAKRGTLGPLVQIAPGVFEAWYLAPLGVESGEDVVEARLPRDKVSFASLPLSLVPGPPVELSATVASRLVTAPSPAPTSVALSVRDAWGNAVDDVVVTAVARHGVVDARGTALGYAPPGSARPGSDRIEIRARARARGQAVALAFSPPSTLLAVDALGRPVPGAELRWNERVLYADGEGRVQLEASSGVIEVQLGGSVLPSLLHLGLGIDGRLHGAPSAPSTTVSAVELTLAPPRAVNVEAEPLARDGDKLELGYLVTGATSGAVHVFVDDKLAHEASALEGRAVVTAPEGSWVTVTHVASGVGAAFRVDDAS